MAHKKGMGSTKNGRDSASQRLGAKVNNPLEFNPIGIDIKTS